MVQTYSLDYETLDKKLDMIMYSVTLTNNNFLYAITAGAELTSFDDEEVTLNESIRTFVLEDFFSKKRPSQTTSNHRRGQSNAPQHSFYASV
jgi:hypothetical protein